MHLEEPTLLVDKDQVIRNIDKIKTKTDKSGVILRPHFKTHISSEIGHWFRNKGIKSITVSSVAMAEYFADSGWNDITIAFPVNILQIQRINELASKINLNLVVETSEVITILDRNLDTPVNIWAKIDTGYKRAGVAWDNFARIISIAKHAEMSNVLSFEGFLVHCGHTYNARSVSEVREIYFDTLNKLNQIKGFLKEVGISNAKISVGDTPSASMLEDFSDVDEIRPGNFVFYDLMQTRIGSCSNKEIAVALACPVVSKYKSRNEILVHGGAVHLSKDSLFWEDGSRFYGAVAKYENGKFGEIITDAYVKNISQEHGILKFPEDVFEDVEIGDILLIYPVHSCLAANCMGAYLTLDGEKITTMLSAKGELGTFAK